MNPKKSFSVGHGALIACLLLCSCLPALAQSTMTVRHQVHHDVSAPLRDLIKGAPAPSLVQHEAEPMRRIPLPPGLVQLEEDPVRQQTVSQQTPSTGLSFEGLGQGQYGFSITGAPPDTEGTVGATQYVQWVNTSFAIFNKSTGALVAGPTAGNTLWSGFGGGCQTNNDGDPIVLYDKAAQRWIFSQFSVSTTPYLQCIAVSTTSDATGTYNRYSFQYSNFDDYPKMAVWSDGYYETFNMFQGGTTFVGADACAYNRSAMLTGAAATQVCFQQGTSVGGLLPSDIDGLTAPPAGSPNYMLYYGTNTLNLFKFHVDFNTPTNSTFTGPTVINVASFSPLCGGGTCVPQPGTTQQLDSLADRLMYRLAYRNFGTHESLVVNHSVVAGSSGGVRWYEIQNPSGTPTVAQQSTFAPDSSYRWMGSVAMDQAGDMALGYSVSSSSLNPTVRYTGRLATDPASTMESEINVVTGSGSQTTGLSRWGDYSAMQVDPVDDCTFWYTQEYIKTNGTFNWSTRIANFKFPSCGGSPDFTVGANPSSLTITQGSNGTSTITVTSLNGFNSATTLSASGLPSGVTAAFSPNPVTPPANGNVTSTLTLTASGTATTGTATVTITGTSGSTTHNTTIALTVNPAAAANFTIGASPSSLTVVQGTNGTDTITITSQNSFNSATTLTASGLPSGVTAAFAPNPVTPPANGSVNSTLTLTASGTATTGTSTVTITGTSGSLVHSTTITLTVTSSGGGGLQTATYSSTFKSPACGSVGSGCDSGPSLLLGRDTLAGGSEPNQPNTIASSCADGTSGTYHSDESNDRLVVQTTDGSNMAPGKTIKVSATVWAYSGYTSDHLDLYYAANASSPSWVLIGTITPTAAGSQVLSANYTLPSGGTNQAVRAQFRYQGSASSCTTGAYNDHDDLVFAVGAGAPGFTVSASPSSVSVAQGSNANSTITVTSVNSFSSATTLTASGLPTGVTAAFSPNPVTPPANGNVTSTLTFTASGTATTGTSTVTITGTSGSIVQTTPITLTVTGTGGPQLAAYDTTLKAPKCATVGTSCDSGTSLLLGKDTMSGGAEPHQPNTINSSCADGTSGTFHSDESNDRLMVTSSGGLLTHGTTVTVTATVWAWSTGSSDALDLYYAANANSPTWVLIGTFVPPAGGAQNISATYTLPTGSLQAVRANFRYQGSASSCSTGAYDDHDDLVFAAN
jgi:hypothetical protein